MSIDLTPVRFWMRRTVRRLYELAGDHPAALPVTLVVTPESVRSRWIDRHTDLVVEGFPRSGNTYAALGVTAAQEAPIRIVSHAHVPAQVKRAVRLGVPTLVVVRQPEDAVCSMAVADSHHRAKDLLRYWNQYHAQIERVREGVVIAPFERVVSDLGGVIEDLNLRFDLALDRFDDADDAARRAVFIAIEDKQRAVHGDRRYLAAVPRPEPRRAEALTTRRAELLRDTGESDRARARDLYRRLTRP